MLSYLDMASSPILSVILLEKLIVYFFVYVINTQHMSKFNKNLNYLFSPHLQSCTSCGENCM